MFLQSFISAGIQSDLVAGIKNKREQIEQITFGYSQLILDEITSLFYSITEYRHWKGSFCYQLFANLPG